MDRNGTGSRSARGVLQAKPSASGPINADMLRGILDCMHAEADERDKHSAQIRSIVAAAKDAGFDTKAVRKVFVRERMDDADRAYQDDPTSTRWAARGGRWQPLRRASRPERPPRRMAFTGQLWPAHGMSQNRPQLRRPTIRRPEKSRRRQMTKGPIACCPESKPVCGKIVGVSQYRIRCRNCDLQASYQTNKARAWRAWWKQFPGNPKAMELSNAPNPAPTANVSPIL